MTSHIRRTAVFCALLFGVLLVNATRVQLIHTGSDDHRQGDRRPAITRYAQPRGDILVGGRPVTGSRDTHEQLRYERTYRDGPLYAPVTGFASQAYGTTLLESAEDELLSGRPPPGTRWPLWDALTRPARTPGGRVATTVNSAAQQAAYAGLAGRKGAVAAVEPSTGRILALVSAPSYDPEVLSGNSASTTRAWRWLTGDPDRPMLNRAIRQTYPPGSTFKVVTAAAALDAGLVRDLDAPTRAPDPYPLPGTATRLENETAGCANASLRYAFTRSCNTVFAALGVRTGLERMAAAARRLGFDDAGLRIPSAVTPSTFATGPAMDAAQLALSSIGQFNTRATPLEMAVVAAAVADGGLVRAPYLVDRSTTREGRPLPAAHRPRPPRRAMSASTARRLRDLMTDTVRRGTGTSAAIDGATVGGKTGTAQHGIGNAGLPFAWFIGWARAEGAARPAVAVAVVVEDPTATNSRAGSGTRAAVDREDHTGGGLAAPIARAVMTAVLGS